MAHFDHKIEQIATPDLDVICTGLEDTVFHIILPDGHEPFRTTGTPVLKCIGLLAIRQPMIDQFKISTSLGPVHAPIGSRIISEELPLQWTADGHTAADA